MRIICDRCQNVVNLEDLAETSKDQTLCRHCAACDSCGTTDHPIKVYGDHSHYCYLCWQSALEHGHRQGLHTDRENHGPVNDCPTCNALIVDLSAAFARRLRDEIGAGNYAEARRVNAMSPDAAWCASHDYCDANMIMLDAFREVFGTDTEVDTVINSGFWAAAWDLWRTR